MMILSHVTLKKRNLFKKEKNLHGVVGIRNGFSWRIALTFILLPLNIPDVGRAHLRTRDEDV
jgi:hypothetical protein